MSTGEYPVMVSFADRFIAQEEAQTRSSKGRSKVRRIAIKCLKGLWCVTKWTGFGLLLIVLTIITLPLAFLGS
jgi:hypothetical protein